MEEITPPKWKRPSEVMRLYKQRMKKRRLNYQHEKKCRFDANVVDDTTTDGTLFRLLNYSQTQGEISTNSSNLSFSNALTLLNSPQSSQQKSEPRDTSEDLNVDWTLRVKARIMSTQPFPWNQKLKTCEEASGITGFVRCIDTDTDNKTINLDTSANARFHQCCLIWQHPSIPWLDMYPRIGKKTASATKVNLLSVKDSMLQNWLDSFRSLFQLVRAKQCPYFYLITNSFICLFRAAGINGYSEINALVTPTSRGFRQRLKEEDIEFTMPLRPGDQTNKSPVTNDSTDTGYESVDPNDDSHDADKYTVNDDEETDVWLETMGLGEADIKTINSTHAELKIGREGSVDDLPESLVFVEGVEAQGLFNFLVNFKSIIPNSGPFAGVPPTLLSPVAFTGASLSSLKVKESIIRQNEQNYHSMEIRGPVLPHMVHNLCDLMKKSNIDKFSLTFANIESSKSLSAATSSYMNNQTKPSPVKTPRTMSIFERQNLSDCGLKPNVLTRFCKNDVLQYDSIKYSDSGYTCS